MGAEPPDVHFHVAPMADGRFRAACGERVDVDQISIAPAPERLTFTTCHWCLKAIEVIALIFGEDAWRQVERWTFRRQVERILATDPEAVLSPLMEDRARSVGLLPQDRVPKKS